MQNLSSSSSSSSLHWNSIWPHRLSHTSLEPEKYVEAVISVVLQPQGVFLHELFLFQFVFLNINKFGFFLDVNHLICMSFTIFWYFVVGFDWIIMWKGLTIIRFNLGVEWVWKRESSGSDIGVVLMMQEWWWEEWKMSVNTNVIVN